MQAVTPQFTVTAVVRRAEEAEPQQDAEGAEE